MVTGVGRSGQFNQPINRGAKLPPEANPWWWHPGRPGVPAGPTSWADRLTEVDSELAVTLNNYTGNYQIWMRKPSIQTSICWGWSFLFPVQPDTPIELVLARLYEASGRKWGNARTYFAAVQREIEREKEAAEKQSLQDTIDQSMEIFNHSQISVSMAGPSSGSKFSDYHA